MRREVQRESPAVGYVWGTSEGERFIRNPDGDMRRLSADGAALLEALADGEVCRADLEGSPRDLVTQLEAEGYLRPGEPVVRLVPPADVTLWPRTLAFGILLLVGLGTAVVQAREIGSVGTLYGTGRIVPVGVLALVSIAIHEAGHYVAARPHLDPSVRLGVVNGVLPSVITDTTGAWVLPRNLRRWITLAGPFVEACWLHVVVATHYLLVPDSVVASALVVVVGSHLVYSLNPLIHGDGYWLLTDTLGVVNLRKRGLEDLRERTPSLAAGYVVLSYGFGLLFVASTVAWLLHFGLGIP